MKDAENKLAKFHQFIVLKPVVWFFSDQIDFLRTLILSIENDSPELPPHIVFIFR